LDGDTIGGDGTSESFEARHVVSSAPIQELVASSVRRRSLSPCAALKYRDFLTVVLIGHRNAHARQWIYIHDPKVKVGRCRTSGPGRRR